MVVIFYILKPFGEKGTLLALTIRKCYPSTEIGEKSGIKCNHFKFQIQPIRA